MEAEKCYIMPSYVVIPDAAAPRDAKGLRPRLKAKIKHIDALLRRDVIAYYDLEEIHNSPLKRKMYFASDDYKKRLALMEKQRAAFLDHEYYITFHADAQFDLDLHTFTYDLWAQSPALNYGLRTRDAHFVEIDFNNYPDDDHTAPLRFFTTPPMDEQTAYQIETSPTDLLLFFRFAEERPSDALSSTDEEVAPLLLIPTHVYLVHQKTGQIFCSYDATATSLFDEADEGEEEEDFDAE